MHYLLKSLVQNTISLLPSTLGQPLYYQVQRRFGALRQPDYAFHLRKAADLADALRQQHLPLDRAFLEVGTGWVLGVPVGLWLAGAAEVHTVDLHAYLREELVLGLLAYIVDNPVEVQEIFPWVPAAELAQKQAVLAGCRSLAEVWAAMPIRYHAPADATALRLPSAQVDYHYSTNVLEHVPAATLAGILAEARRVLRPGGYLLHFVDLSDHFAHDDPRRTAVHFLRHSPWVWSLLAGNRFMYQNRLRLPQYRQLLTEAGLRIVWQQAFTEPANLTLLSQPGAPVHTSFQRFTPEELAVNFWKVLAQAEH